MLLNTRDWSKAGALATIGLICGIALRTPKQGDAAVSAPPSHSPIADLSDAFATVAQQAKPAVVFVQSQHVERVSTQRGSIRLRLRVAQGSGFLASSDGYILTNNHVVAGADRVTVRLYDKRQFMAQVVGTDPNTDVAVIKIEARNLPTVPYGNSDSTRVGEWALAIGNPLGEAFTFTITAGIISAKGRVLAGFAQTPAAIQDFIQTDAATNPGNSGGPLVNTRGQVIGINSAIASGTGFYIGYGFAIPINLARTVMDQLIRNGRVERTVVGLSVRDATEADAGVVGLKQITGVVVDGYTSGDSPAKQAGIQPGDVIVALGGEPVESAPQLQERVGFKQPGETVAVTLVRQRGERKTVTLRLARAPSDAGRGGGNPSVTPNGDASGNGAAPVGPSPIYDGGTLAPVVYERERETPMLRLLFLLAAHGPVIAPAHSPAGDPPVRLWLSSHGDYEHGDRAKIHARAAQDGYLVVLHADADGRVHVLFPIDPGGDQQVRGGKKYELKGRGDREAFMVTDTSGHGAVLAAFAKTPFVFDRFEKDEHWDYAALSDQFVKVDPEAGLLAIVQRMQADDEHFEYDVSTYVSRPRDVRPAAPYRPWSDWWDFGYGGLGFGFGPGPGYYYWWF